MQPLICGFIFRKRRDNWRALATKHVPAPRHVWAKPGTREPHRVRRRAPPFSHFKLGGSNLKLCMYSVLPCVDAAQHKKQHLYFCALPLPATLFPFRPSALRPSHAAPSSSHSKEIDIAEPPFDKSLVDTLLHPRKVLKIDIAFKVIPVGSPVSLYHPRQSGPARRFHF